MAKNVQHLAFKGAPPTKGEIVAKGDSAKPKALIVVIKDSQDFQTIRAEDTPEEFIEALAKEVNWQG